MDLMAREGLRTYFQTCSYVWLLSVAYRSNNFIVGLSSSYPVVTKLNDHVVQLWNYTVCGQYPGHVASGATVTVQCSNVCERALHFKYVIVQFPLTNDQMNFCEIDVFAIGTIFCSNNSFLEKVKNAVKCVYEKKKKNIANQFVNLF